MGNFRDRRVAQELQREINEILQKRVRDPRVQEVTITDVHVTGDLSLATVYYSILSDFASDNEQAAIGLKKATGIIKRELGKQLSLYKIPDLTFVKDESVQYGNKIDQMLRDLNKKD
ncbi:MAG: 30S ribosome-binding factor RbfA [Streptococcaceae bacterium]|jgi:ribosome-binding factor A|nr:30S ribosome-binding factor RbfA [Streptococcaceae bacterium]